MRDEIVAVLHEAPHRWSAAAVGWKLGRPPHGPLGQDPDPDVAEALTHLVADGAAEFLPGCPVCGRTGGLYAAPGYGGAEESAPPVAWAETIDAMIPLIDEGLIEVGENIELDVRECCARAGRPWRRTPRPA